MALHTGWVFSCSEREYDKFLPFLPDDAPRSYVDFAVLVDRYVDGMAEQQTVLKVPVAFDDFLSFCKSERREPSFEALRVFTFRSWGSLPDA